MKGWGLAALLLLGIILSALIARPSSKPGEDAVAKALRKTVTRLATDFPERNTENPRQYKAAADWVAKALGGKHVTVQEFQANGVSCRNLVRTFSGKAQADEVILVGAHYDSVPGSPAANDNASGTAALIWLAQQVAKRPAMRRTVRFVAFANEEPPHFQTATMGSLVYANACAERGEDIVAMLSLETMGYYTDAAKSQKYPPLLAALYPNQGNFLAVVGNPASKKLARWMKRRFAARSALPVESASYPAGLPGIGWSDHWSFWKHGTPAVMITDTAPFRYPHYHLPSDTPDKLTYPAFAEATVGLLGVLTELANGEDRFD